MLNEKKKNIYTNAIVRHSFRDIKEALQVFMWKIKKTTTKNTILKVNMHFSIVLKNTNLRSKNRTKLLIIYLV